MQSAITLIASWGIVFTLLMSLKTPCLIYHLVIGFTGFISFLLLFCYSIPTFSTEQWYIEVEL